MYFHIFKITLRICWLSRRILLVNCYFCLINYVGSQYSSECFANSLFNDNLPCGPLRRPFGASGPYKDVYKHLKLLNISKKINTPLQLASSIIFKKNKNSGKKIKQIGKKILKKTINELDNLINNEYKKT